MPPTPAGMAGPRWAGPGAAARAPAAPVPRQFPVSGEAAAACAGAPRSQGRGAGTRRGEAQAGGRGQPAKLLGRHPRPQRAGLPPKPGSPPPAGLSAVGRGAADGGIPPAPRPAELLPAGVPVRAIATLRSLRMGLPAGTSPPRLSSATLPPKRCPGGRAACLAAPGHGSWSPLQVTAASAPLTSPTTGTVSAGTATTTTTIITAILNTATATITTATIITAVTINIIIITIIIITIPQPAPVLTGGTPAHLCHCRPGRAAQLAPAPTRYIARPGPCCACARAAGGSPARPPPAPRSPQRRPCPTGPRRPPRPAGHPASRPGCPGFAGRGVRESGTQRREERCHRCRRPLPRRRQASPKHSLHDIP
ncbi:transcription initiation factor TFIID subunit 4-like [Corvus kubaryi]|uniref:transcription initiation factor TFIID subunit 4-like n=1 Tax=Corvus kubaryi TaxID=68294 RepID=UPI001C0547FC|nr:transcription initiation factor TFIID subunit 4-like [Corvus kubaryi]